VHHRAPGSSGWVVVEDRPVLDGGLIDPLFIEADGTWVVRSSRGRDTEGLFSYDPQARRLLPEPLVAVDGFDVRGAITFDEAQQLISSAWVRADRWQPVCLAARRPREPGALRRLRHGRALRRRIKQRPRARRVLRLRPRLAAADAARA
jgi:hypothetical protein